MVALSFYPALGVDLVIWAVWSTAVSLWSMRWTDDALRNDGWLTHLRAWERDGLAYATLGIRRWKGWLPDLAVLVGGQKKQLRDRRDPAAWQELAGETRRAERAHWLILLALPMQLMVRGGVILAPMAAYGLLANGPCIAAQRYNRGRLGVLSRRREGRADIESHIEPRVT
jgi:glycosyl-4,4'-diaponeurosporenoate acyltransferase